jgi:hypothetical protein
MPALPHEALVERPQDGPLANGWPVPIRGRHKITTGINVPLGALVERLPCAIASRRRRRSARFASKCKCGARRMTPLPPENCAANPRPLP